jgi:hypothetical protein
VHDPVAGELEIRVAGCVSFTVTTGAVIGEAVQLDDEAIGGPERVDLVYVLVALYQHIQNRAG